MQITKEHKQLERRQLLKWLKAHSRKNKLEISKRQIAGFIGEGMGRIPSPQYLEILLTELEALGAIERIKKVKAKQIIQIL